MEIAPRKWRPGPGMQVKSGRRVESEIHFSG